MQQFTENELILFIDPVNRSLGCDPDFFIAKVRAALDYLDYDKEDLMSRLESMPKSDLAELVRRCEDFWKTPYSIPDIRTRLIEVGLL